MLIPTVNYLRVLVWEYDLHDAANKKKSYKKESPSSKKAYESTYRASYI